MSQADLRVKQIQDLSRFKIRADTDMIAQGPFLNYVVKQINFLTPPQHICYTFAPSSWGHVLDSVLNYYLVMKTWPDTRPPLG